MRKGSDQKQRCQRVYAIFGQCREKHLQKNEDPLRFNCDIGTRNWLRREESLGGWTARALARLEEVFSDHDHKNRSVWRGYLPHARYVLASNLVDDGAVKKTVLRWKFGMCLYSDGRYDEAEESFSQVMEMRKRALGQEHPDTLTSAGNLASMYRDQGRWKEAEKLEMQVMETSKRVLEQEHPDTLTNMANLAST
jgi:tetratricopeptide (TPR) repeat protein